MDKCMNYLGIARKAGFLAIGEKNSGAAARSGRAQILLLAADASDNARKRAEGFALGGKLPPPVRLPYSMEHIAGYTGKTGSVLALTDPGIAYSFVAGLTGEIAGLDEIANLLLERNQQALRRRKEAAAHAANKRAGKRRKSV